MHPDKTSAGSPVIGECEGCGSRFPMPSWLPDRKYRCGKCRGELRRVSMESRPGSLDLAVSAAAGHHSGLAALVAESGKGASEAPKPGNGSPGRLGRIRLVKELGRGGMGVVYLGRDEELRRTLAVKVLLDGRNESLRQRFLREARLVSKLRHPNIVAVHEFGEEEGRAYFTMDFIEGGPLDSLFGQPGFAPRPLLDLAARVARALDYAHREGMIHRDVKPQNILVSKDRTPYLTDFGLAREVESNTRLTMSGAVMGTPSYMSPEQAQGGANVDARTDIYSLGAVLYEGLTGRPPFEMGNLIILLEAICREDPQPPSAHAPGLPADVDTIVLKALQKDPARRYQSGAAMADDIERFLRGESIVARRSGAFEKAVNWAKRRPAVAAGSAAGLAALLVIGLVMRNSAANQRALRRQQEEQRRKANEEAALRDEEARLERERLAAKIRDLEARLAGASPEEQEKIRRELNVLTGRPAPSEWDGLLTRVATLLGGREYAAAIGALEAWTPASATEASARDAKLREVRDLARKRFETASRDAGALESAGRIPDAIAAWRALETIGIPELAKQARAEADRLAAVAAASPENPDALPVEIAWLRVGVAGRLRARDFEGARALLDEAAVPAEDIDRLEWARAALARFYDALKTACTDPSGLAVLAWDTEAPAKVLGWSDRGLRVQKESGALSLLPIDDVRPGELVRAVAPAALPPECVALFWCLWDSPRLGATEPDRAAARAANEKTGLALLQDDAARARLRAWLDGLRAAEAVCLKNPPPAAPARPPLPEGWTEIFDGTSLAGFVRRAGLSVAVANGALVLDGAELTTSRTWKSVEVEIDFTLAGQGRMSSGLRGAWLAAADVPAGPHRLRLRNEGLRGEAALDGRPLTLLEWKPGASGAVRFKVEGAVARVKSVRWRAVAEPEVVVEKPAPNTQGNPPPPDKPPPDGTQPGKPPPGKPPPGKPPPRGPGPGPGPK